MIKLTENCTQSMHAAAMNVCVETDAITDYEALLQDSQPKRRRLSLHRLSLNSPPNSAVWDKQNSL